MMSALPRPLRSLFRSLRKTYRAHIDRFYFPLWLVFQCARHRKRAVILRRINAMGDVVCTLPMCGEIRKRHPGKLVVFLTTRDYKSLVLLAHAADLVYGEQAWGFSVSNHYLGLIEAVYNPLGTNERSNDGTKSHLMDDLAGSCGFTISDRQPRLFPPPELIEKVQSKYGIAGDVAGGRLIIGINCGQVWPVRMWDAAKWQALVDLIHAGYDAAILLFGFRKDGVAADEYDHLRGVQHVLRMMMGKDELVALVANCHLMISVESGTVHVAGAVGVPVVGLYGALEPRHCLPQVSPAVGVFSEVPCRFCHHATPIGHWKSGCPHDIRCMKELDVQPVFQAVKAMLAKHGKRRG